MVSTSFFDFIPQSPIITIPLMKLNLRPLTTLLLLTVIMGPIPLLKAQNYSSTDSRVQLANLTQDVRILSQRVGQLQVRLEQLEKENAALRKQAIDQKDLEARLNQLNSTLQKDLNTVRQNFQSADEAQKAAIIKAVSSQISDLAEQTQKTIDALADYVGHQGTSIPAVEFSDDFPNTGFRYQVMPGDSLAKIAQKHGVNIRDIINANRIVNPDKIQVGENLFIPKAQE